MTMSILFFERLKRKVRTSTIYLFCIFMMAMFTGGCASQQKKETTLKIPAPPAFSELSASHAKETGQALEKSESEKNKTNDDQKIICRRMPITGSRITKKLCATKEEWALWDKNNQQNAEGYIRDANEAARTDTSLPFPPTAPPDGLGALLP
jgi:hypothetical protein